MDIDRSKQLLTEQNERINEQRVALEKAHRELLMMHQFRKDTLKVIVHDVRNFSSIVSMILDTIDDERGSLSDDMQTALSHIEESNNRLMQFLQKLNATRQENPADALRFVVTDFDLNEEISNTLTRLSPNLFVKNLTVENELDPQPMIVSLDQLFVGQVLFKLLSTVCSFAHDGAVISIRSCICDGNTAAIEVTDKSRPIIDQQKLASLFIDLPEHEPVPGNTGTGLSGVRQLLQEMGGQLIYASTKEKGTYFRIEIGPVKTNQP